MDRTNVVFSKSTGHFTSPRGHSVLILLGSHWHEDDEMVTAFPDNFSDDPAYGLSYSQMPVGKPAVHQEPRTADPVKEDTVTITSTSTKRGLPPAPKKDQA